MGEQVVRKTACVTGATGYIAAALTKLLLEHGYAVHATTRNPDSTKIAQLVALRSIGEVKIFRADLREEGSFDDAVRGCDYVFHVAIPDGGLESEDAEGLIKSAVDGTLNVLRACAKVKTVRRVVYTSSAAAISVNRSEGTGHIVDEESWTDVDFLSSEKPPSWGYLVGKTLAEREAWRFAKENNLDLVALNPVLVIGPSLSPDPPFAVRLGLAFLTGEQFMVDALKFMQKLSGSVSIVHLDDVCRAHLFAAETETAAGRYVVAKVNTGVKELARFLHSRYSQYGCKIELEDVADTPKLSLSSEKIIKEGFKFKHEDLEGIYDDVVAYGKKMGMLPLPN